MAYTFIPWIHMLIFYALGEDLLLINVYVLGTVVVVVFLGSVTKRPLYICSKTGEKGPDPRMRVLTTPKKPSIISLYLFI